MVRVGRIATCGALEVAPCVVAFFPSVQLRGEAGHLEIRWGRVFCPCPALWVPLFDQVWCVCVCGGGATSGSPAAPCVVAFSASVSLRARWRNLEFRRLCVSWFCPSLPPLGIPRGNTLFPQRFAFGVLSSFSRSDCVARWTYSILE